VFKVTPCDPCIFCMTLKLFNEMYLRKSLVCLNSIKSNLHVHEDTWIVLTYTYASYGFVTNVMKFVKVSLLATNSCL
jgi:hypothetical protein